MILQIFHRIAHKLLTVQVEIVRAMLDERVYLAEGALIEQNIKSFARGQASFFVLRFDTLRSATQTGFRLLITQILNVLLVAHVPHFLKESFLSFD